MDASRDMVPIKTKKKKKKKRNKAFACGKKNVGEFGIFALLRTPPPLLHSLRSNPLLVGTTARHPAFATPVPAFLTTQSRLLLTLVGRMQSFYAVGDARLQQNGMGHSIMGAEKLNTKAATAHQQQAACRDGIL